MPVIVAYYELVTLSSLRRARAAAMRVDVNEPTNLETAKALWAYLRSEKARPGR